MRFYEATSSIGARPEDVWTVLVDGSQWTSWDSGVDGVQGTIAAGGTLTIRSKAAPGRAFPVNVVTFDPPRALTFRGGMPLGLFTGVRTYRLTAQSDGGTTITVREEYTGPLLRPIWRSMPDLGPSFTQFVTGLKRRVETGS